MAKYISNRERRTRRHLRIRKKIIGSTERPRLCVNISAKHIYLQVVDDDKGVTIVSTSTLDPELRKNGTGSNVQGAEVLGKQIAEKTLEKGIKEVVYDRGGFKYHGRVKAIAEAARTTGLKI